jgi:hypothetical protein
MGLMDELEDKGKDLMNDPAKKAKIEQIAKDKGLSIDEAKDHFLKHENR